MRLRAVVLVAAFAALAASAAAARPANVPTPPDVSRIVADFRETAFATYYSIDVKTVPGRKVHILWTLYGPKNDPRCRKFTTSAGDPDRAVWEHGDADGCDHTKMNSRGHVGSVFALVSDGVYVCSAEYRGTISGTGDEPECQTTARRTADSQTRIAQHDESEALRTGDDGYLRNAREALDKAIEALASLDGVKVAKAVAHLRRAKTLDQLATEVSSKRKGEIEKAIAEKSAALGLIAQLP